MTPYRHPSVVVGTIAPSSYSEVSRDEAHEQDVKKVHAAEPGFNLRASSVHAT